MTDEAPKVEMQITPEVEIGTYADFAVIWHTSDVFTLDFGARMAPVRMKRDEVTGAEQSVLPCRIVSRIRIPPAQVWEIMKALEKQLTQWEAERQGTPPAQ